MVAEVQQHSKAAERRATRQRGRERGQAAAIVAGPVRRYCRAACLRMLHEEVVR